MMNSNSNTNVVVEGIKYCFSHQVDTQSLKIAHDFLKSLNVGDSDINTAMFMFAATCAKHYKYGYVAAQSKAHKKTS